MSIVLLPIVLVAGVWLHELLHAGAAVLVGGRLEQVDLYNLHVDFRAPTERREWLVLNAPALVGLSLLPVVLALVSDWTGAVLLLSGWGAMTLTGGDNEIGLPGLLQRVRV